ncbi:MAG: 50S ribosomal protein L31 [Candidatus Saganbacteria bacterium]|nr:50S ribosomal protein L31 [Candidatus Saganbacteria bacterium]
MREKIHPKTFITTATCACGAVYKISSTKENIRVDICSACHPLFTGKQKLMDTEGRVSKFKKKYAGVKTKTAKRRVSKSKKRVKSVPKKAKPKSKKTKK